MLELDTQAFNHLMQAVLKRTTYHLDTLDEQPASIMDPRRGAELATQLREEAPETPTAAEELLDTLFDEAIPCGYNTASAGYMGYVPGGGIVHAAVADFISDITNRYVGIWPAAPALVQIETNVIRWFCDMIGYPEHALGFLTTGGSMANFSAVVAARTNKLGEDFLKGCVYVSDQVHHSMTKAALMAGFPKSNIRIIPTGAHFRMCTDSLEKAIREDRLKGRSPMMLIGSAGTTNLGAIDPLHTLADIAHRENLWLHVDGAYGGFFCMTEVGHRKLSGIERADSVTLDPHKGLFLPYGTGALLVRNRDTLIEAFDAHGEYLPPFEEHPDHIDYCRISPELSRDFRGLRVWLPIKMEGLAAFRAALDEKLELAAIMRDAVVGHADLELITEPELSTVAFKLRSRGESIEETNGRTRALLSDINHPQRVFLTGTMLHDTFVIRVCILSFRTHHEHVQYVIDRIYELLASQEIQEPIDHALRLASRQPATTSL
ncbi:MAG: aminotransferase class V-fold PLP-dependent enzyme [Myxococcota bacterium]|nr:aminotransferase class V-fold PLP-dependent enzyme [Myxococcota bacterium]